MRICLDFDGVLHDTSHIVPGKRMGPPTPGARDACVRLRQQGHHLVVHTARVHSREQAQHVHDWLRYFDFPPMLVLVEKPVADVYVDDKGLRHEADWDATMVKLRILGAS